MGTSSSTVHAPVVLKNQTGLLLKVRVYSVATDPLSSVAAEVCQREEDVLIGRHLELATNDHGQAQFAAYLPRRPAAAEASRPQSGRGRGGAGTRGGPSTLSASACLATVLAGTEVSAVVDRSGSLVLRVFEKAVGDAKDEGGGAWKVIPTRDALRLFEMVSDPESLALASTGSAPKQQRTSAASSRSGGNTIGVGEDLDEDEEGLYLTEGQCRAQREGSSGKGKDSDLVDSNVLPEEEEERPPAMPAECVCPISHSLFHDPVLAADGFTYERRCIEAWLSKPRPSGSGSVVVTSPMTGRPLENARLIPNLAIKSMCWEYRARWGEGPQPMDAKALGGGGGSSSSCQPAAATDDVGPFAPHLDALQEMFVDLPAARIREVCAELAAQGGKDLDAAVRRLLLLYEEGREEGQAPVLVAALPLTAVSMDTEQAEGSGIGSAAAAGSEAEHIKPPDDGVNDHLAVPGFEELHHELVRIAGFNPVAARKAVLLGCATDMEEAVVWLEKHENDPDLDVPEEELEERERYRLHLAVMRVATIPDLSDRVEAYILLHKIMGKIMSDPENARWRKIRSSNRLFRQRLARFKPAMSLLRLAGFRMGDFWTSHQDREPCVEFVLPIDSDNPTSIRFVRIFTLLDEILTNQEEWFGLFLHDSESKRGQRLVDRQVQGGPRQALADIHEWRARDARGYYEAMRAQGKVGNKVVVNITQTLESPAPRLAEGQDRYRSLRERFGGRREFSLQDLEQMRYDDAIRGATLFAEEYVAQRNRGAVAEGRDSYSALRNRYYDPQYLGRLCVDRTNAFRAQNRLPPLRWCQQIADIAEEHAQQMARGEMPFSHLDFDKRVAKYPFPHYGAGENLAYNGGHADVANMAVEQWINSPGHRKNLLGTWNLCGVGVAQTAGGMFYFTQLFARTGAALA